MAYSKAQDKATRKYQREKMDSIAVRYPKGTKQPILDHIELTGESLAGFILRAINETIDRDKKRIAELMKEDRK